MIEDDLRALGPALEWPPTPDLASAVRARLEPEPADRVPVAARSPYGRFARRRPGLIPPPRPLVLAAAAVLALLVATALVPPARSAVLRVLGLTASERIVRAPRPPDVSRGPLETGRPTTLADAEQRAAFLRLPAALGPPGRVFYSRALAGGAVTLRWPSGDALTEFEGRGVPLLEKYAAAATRVRKTTVQGATAFFLDGAPHEIIVLDRYGIPVQGTRALVRGRVLLWDAGGVAYRLETQRDLRGALAVAASIPRG